MKGAIANPLNSTQRDFNELCRRGGGARGGPARTKVQELLRASGLALNIGAYDEIADSLATFPSANPWHVCFAMALCWGRLAKRDHTFTEAVINLFDCWNSDDLKTARAFPYEKGPDAIEESLIGANHLFSTVRLPPSLPGSVRGMKRAQDAWLTVVSRDAPRFIGGWNSTAMFMVALFAQPKLAETVTEPDILLPIGGPIFGGLKILHEAGCSDAPIGTSKEGAGPDLGHIAINTGLIASFHRGRTDWSLLDVHSGLYMLGTRLAESDGWF